MNKFDLWPSLRLYEKLGVPYILHSDSWHGPLWTGHCMMLNVKDSYGDVGFFHELAHWLATPEEDRKYPDFRLGRWVNAAMSDSYTFGTSTVETWCGPENITPTGAGNRGWGEVTVNMGIADANEGIACAALAIYEPLCGVIDWGKLKIDYMADINGAIEDFNASEIDVYLTPAMIKNLHEQIIKPIDPSVTLAVARGYLKRLLKAREEAYA